MVEVETLIAQAWPGLDNLRKRRNKDEWHSSCPRCGGGSKSDRWMMTPYFNQESPTIAGYCRQCEYQDYVFLDEFGKRKEGPILTDEEREALRQQLMARKAKEDAEAIDRLKYHAGKIQVWHDAMTEPQRALWHEHWIDDNTINKFQLGLQPDKIIGNDENGPIRAEALVLPIWGQGWELGNIQWRIVKPVRNGDRYRQVGGLPPRLFHVYPDMPIEGTVYVTEGVKKALCLNQVISRVTGEMCNIIAVNNSNPEDELIVKMENASRLYLILDPDTRRVRDERGRTMQDRVLNRMAFLNPNTEIYPINLSAKLDDYFYQYGFTYDDFEKYIQRARPIMRASKAEQFKTLRELRQGV